MKTQSNFQRLTKLRRYATAITLTVTILASLGLVRSSLAIPFTFTLTGVTFDDGASATGFFVLDPTTGNYGPFDISTTTSVSNPGSTYSNAAGTSPFYLSSPDEFIFDNFGVDDHYLSLSYLGHITGPGTYLLDPGAAIGPGSFSGSGEYVNADFSTTNYRLVTAGALTVASVPDTGGTLSSLVIALAALSGFRIFNRTRARA